MSDAPSPHGDGVAPAQASSVTSPKRVIRLLVLVLIRSSALVVIVALLWPGRPYELDMIAQLSPQLSILLGVLSLIAALAHRRTRRCGIEGLAACALVLTISFIQYSSARAGADPIGRDPNLRVVTFNGQGGSAGVDYEGFTSWLLEQNADLVCVVEAPARFLVSDDWIQDTYPYRIRPDSTWRWPIVLLSKHPFERVKLAPTDEIVRHSFVRIRSMLVEFEADRQLLFTAMHQPSPRSRESWERGKREALRDARLLSDYRAETGVPIILAGDFNATPQGASFRLFARETGFRGASSVLGAQGSWPASAPRRFSLPIDHVWVTEEIQLVAAESGPDFGSDHRPVRVDLLLGVNPDQ